MKYKGYLVVENDGFFSGSIAEIDAPEIELGKVLIKVHYSSLNYKDALAATGAKGVVRSYPFVPGIDVAGEIIESMSPEFSVGERVLATGYKIGMSEFGGFGEIVHIPSKWVIKMPSKLNYVTSMSYGTAGITAAACVKKVIDANCSKELPVIVSGATGGVGSVAIGILSKLGYEVHAISGKSSQLEVLSMMGAKKVIDRNEYLSQPTKPMDKGIYSAAVDTVGGDILSKILSMISNNGVISCCGNVAGPKFSSSVFPFILRGIQLSGIDSAESSINLKQKLWNLLSDEWSLNLSNQTKVIKISEIGKEIDKILKGNQIGRVVIKHGE